jgi:ribonucleotide monophosphatase NagD (HAD superfamily)
LRLDIGPFVAGLEYATGKTADVAGKPSPAFFRSALEAAGVSADEAVMVGDDIRGDIGGAQQLGIGGVLVRTGKYREDDVAASGVTSDRVIYSVADLADVLGIA